MRKPFPDSAVLKAGHDTSALSAPQTPAPDAKRRMIAFVTAHRSLVNGTAVHAETLAIPKGSAQFRFNECAHLAGFSCKAARVASRSRLA